MRFLIMGLLLGAVPVFAESSLSPMAPVVSCQAGCDRAQNGALFICSKGRFELDPSRKNIDSKDLSSGLSLAEKETAEKAKLQEALGFESITTRNDLASKSYFYLSQINNEATSLCNDARAKSEKACASPCSFARRADFAERARILTSDADFYMTQSKGTSAQADAVRDLSNISSNSLREPASTMGIMGSQGVSSCVGFDQCIKEGTHSSNIEDRRDEPSVAGGSGSYVVPVGWEKGGVED